MNANVKKYGPVLVIGVVVGVGLSIVDPFGIKDSQSAPEWLKTLYDSSWQMAVAGAVLAMVIYLLYEKFTGAKGVSYAQAHTVGHKGNRFSRQIPSEYYTRGTKYHPIKFDNRVPRIPIGGGVMPQ